MYFQMKGKPQMCIMEVRPGQHDVTIAQAIAHNLNTVLGDLDMYEKKAKASHNDTLVATIHRTRENTKKAYADMLSEFGMQLAEEIQDPDGHWTKAAAHNHGNERTFTEVVEHETNLAHSFETR